jgi:hypothetical protein
MEDNRWIGHIYRPNPQDEVSDFVSLWETIQDIRLNSEADDEIKWP